MKYFIILLIGISLSISTVAQDTISVANFGLLPNTRENAVPYVRKAMDMAKKKKSAVLLFPKGRYDFWPQHCIERNYFESNTSDNNPKRLAILIDNMTNFNLDGDGSLFVMHDRMQPVTIDHSKQISLKNFSVDWDIPLTAQGEVVKISTEYFDVRINKLESPYVIEKGKLVFVGEGWKSPLFEIMEFQSDTKYVEPYTGDDQALGHDWYNYQVQEIESGVVRFSRAGGFLRYPVLGNWLVLRHSKRDHAGIFLLDSKDIHLDNINIHHTAGLGILSQYTENISFNKVKVIPNKQKGRFLSGHDDGFHFMGCKGLIKVENCEWAGLMDDPINIHGTCVRIIDLISATEIKCKFMHPQSKGMLWGKAGEIVSFIENKSMRSLAIGEIKSLKVLNKTEFIVEFIKPTPSLLKVGAALENLTWTPNVEIRNSVLGSCRARGLLISTPGKVVIEDNIFESSGSAILIAGDANQWYESGAVKDVLIRNNEFRYICMSSMYQFCEGIISVSPEIPQPDSKYPFHRNIRIENNTFHPFDYPILFAKSVDGLSFTGNKLIRSKKISPFHKRKFGFTFNACKHVLIKGNHVEGNVLGKEIKLENMSRKNLKLDTASYFKLTK